MALSASHMYSHRRIRRIRNEFVIIIIIIIVVVVVLIIDTATNN